MKYPWKKPDLISFEYDGKKYSMTEDEIEAAYRYKQRQFRLEDAREQVDFYVYSWHPGDLDEEEKDKADKDFEGEHGFPPVVLYSMLDAIVTQFDRFYKPEIKEDDAWDAAIQVVMDSVKGGERQ